MLWLIILFVLIILLAIGIFLWLRKRKVDKINDFDEICNDFLVCTKGVCKEGKCVEEKICGNDTVLINGKCVEKGCSNCPENSICIENTCIPCGKNEKVIEGENKCVSKTCEELNCGSEGKKCINRNGQNYCVKCEDGKKLVNGECISKTCKDDINICADGQYCDESGNCVYCKGELEVNEEKTGCVEQKCEDICTGICIDGRCVTGYCETTDDCNINQECIENKCVEREDEKGEVECVYEEGKSGCPQESICTTSGKCQQCPVGSVKVGNECVKRKCRLQGSDIGHYNCSAPTVCDDETRECIECKDDEMWENGRCRKKTCDDLEFNIENQYCINSTIVTCPYSQIVDRSSGYPECIDRECSESVDCGVGEKCENGVCRVCTDSELYSGICNTKLEWKRFLYYYGLDEIRYDGLIATIIPDYIEFYSEAKNMEEFIYDEKYGLVLLRANYEERNFPYLDLTINSTCAIDPNVCFYNEKCKNNICVPKTCDEIDYDNNTSVCICDGDTCFIETCSEDEIPIGGVCQKKSCKTGTIVCNDREICTDDGQCLSCDELSRRNGEELILFTDGDSRYCSKYECIKPGETPKKNSFSCGENSVCGDNRKCSRCPFGYISVNNKCVRNTVDNCPLDQGYVYQNGTCVNCNFDGLEITQNIFGKSVCSYSGKTANDLRCDYSEIIHCTNSGCRCAPFDPDDFSVVCDPGTIPICEDDSCSCFSNV